MASLGSAFDQIVCTGVLHHLPDPDAGLRAVAGRAGTRRGDAPHGVRPLRANRHHHAAGALPAVWGSAAARRRRTARSLCSRCRRCRPDIRWRRCWRGHGPAGRSGAGRCAAAPAGARVHSAGAVHVSRAGATSFFGRWLKQAPYSPRCGLIAATPHTDRIANYPGASRPRPSSCCAGPCFVTASSRTPTPELPPPTVWISAGRRWQRYVPIRLPDTIRRRRAAAAGAAAVLIDRTHPCPDIHLVIDRREKAVHDAIDGVRSAGEVARAVGWAGGAAAFFERLYEHDQIVFDASG